MFSLQIKLNPNVWVLENPRWSWHCLTPASPQTTSSLTTCPLKITTYIFDLKTFPLDFSNAWNILPFDPQKTESPTLTILSIHTLCITSGLSHYSAEHVYYPKLLLFYRFVIHLSPLDCKLHEEKDFNSNLLLGP